MDSGSSHKAFNICSQNFKSWFLTITGPPHLKKSNPKWLLGGEYNYVGDTFVTADKKKTSKNYQTI